MKDSVKSLADMGKVVSGGAVPAPAVELHSRTVGSGDRAGRAPYNFVPLADRWRQVDEPPKMDSYQGLSGVIELTLEAKTDFYVRGMYTLEEYQAQLATPQDEKKLPMDPFQVDRCLRLPGSSLRGLIRNLVEILAKAPLDAVNDQRFFYRTVGSIDEPHHGIYRERIGGGVRNRRDYGLKVRPGYLYGSKNGKWHIKPASLDTWYRVKMDDLSVKGLPKLWDNKEVVYFRPNPEPKRPEASISSSTELGALKGRLICTGSVPKKNKQWIIHEENTSGRNIEIPQTDVGSYLEAGQTQINEPGYQKKESAFRYTDESAGVPCFYVKWTKPTKAGEERRVSFGHTPHFRIPFENTTHNSIPEANRRKNEGDWDMAQALFGRAPTLQIDGRKGRVFFEDAIETTDPKEPEYTKVVLGTPKPSTFQHYLVQTSDRDPRECIHWDSPNPILRGHKIYWHRPKAEFQEATEDQEKVASKFKRAKAGAIFQGQVRYENLSPEELGALLTAIQLPNECAHKLGMGKPLGFGSFRVEVTALNDINRSKRYSAFFEKDSNVAEPRVLATGATDIKNKIAEYQKNFADWYRPDGADFWKDPRLAELKALLRYKDLPAQWSKRTRYLLIEPYNEYTHLGPRQPNKRRPLPPATQVLEGGSGVPDGQ